MHDMILFFLSLSDISLKIQIISSTSSSFFRLLIYISQQFQATTMHNDQNAPDCSWPPNPLIKGEGVGPLLEFFARNGR